MTDYQMQDRPYAAIKDLNGNITGYLHALLTQDYGYPLWSQRDSRWAGEMLGFNAPGSKWTIGNYGCLLTDFAMALTNHMDREITPSQLNNQLKNVNGFTSGSGNIIYSKITELYPTFKFKSMGTYTDIPAPVQEIEAWLKAGNYCMIKIDMVLTTPAVDEHWLLLTSGTVDKFYAHDPWPMPDAQELISVPPAYCKQGWTAARAIYGDVRFENLNPKG